MNPKTKKIFLTLALASLLLVSSCQNDYYEENGQQGTVKITEKRFDELIVNNKFRALFEAIPKKKHSFSTALQARTAMEDQYDFTIVDVPIKVATADNLTSYTMLITREDQSNSYFENLVIQEDVDNNKQAVILKYKPIEVSEEIAHDSFDFTGTIEMQKIALNTNSFGYAGTDVCSVTWTMCNYGGSEHVAGPRCTQVYTKTMSVLCDTGTPTGGNNSGGSGGDGGAGSSSGGSGGDGGGPGSVIPDEEVVTSPITPGLVSPDGFGVLIPKTPCAQLSKMGNDPGINEKLSELESLTGLDHENGYGVTKDPITGNYGTPHSIPQNPLVPNELNIKNFQGGSFIGTMHNHPDYNYGYYPMFSDADVVGLYNLATQHDNYGHSNEVNPSEFFDIMSSLFGTYAIKIKDFEKFKISMKKKRERFRKKMDLAFPQDGSTPSDILNYEKKILAIFKDIDMGVGLYKAKPNTNFGEWEELVLDSSPNNPPIKKPCN